MANVAKHAHASAVAINVYRSNDQLVVEVADDGVGGADPAKGSGLRGLADRLAALDGRLEVRSTPDQGTQVVAEIPWRERTDVEANAIGRRMLTLGAVR